jgi:hypothetical protein
MEQSVEIIKDSIGPTGKRITTMLINHWRCIHPELLRHRLLSFSVASSRAIPYEVQMEQVSGDPMMPILWPKSHKGMQGAEVFEAAPEKWCSDMEYHSTGCELDWLCARNNAVKISEKLSKYGLSKQLTNRLLEPWVNTRALVTSTEWDNFFELRAPWHWHYEDGREEGNYRIWEDQVNLTFPAEYNIQDLAIKMRKALQNSTPIQLTTGQWHLPFIEPGDENQLIELYGLGIKNKNYIDDLINISAARCARTSYGKNIGKSIEDELKLANTLLKEKHLSPFEHQARALDQKYHHPACLDMAMPIPHGCELRIKDSSNGRLFEIWSGNFKEWTQYRKLSE